MGASNRESIRVGLSAFANSTGTCPFITRGISFVNRSSGQPALWVHAERRVCYMQGGRAALPLTEHPNAG